jgi:heat-inducible transcriptional repressor
VSKALKLGLLATGVPPTEKVFIEGTGSFLEAPEFADVERMKALFRTLEEKTRLVALLDRVQRAREVQIFIGHESDLSPGGDVSLVATPYGPADRSLGTVGVIGPTRMNYQRVIPWCSSPPRSSRRPWSPEERRWTQPFHGPSLGPGSRRSSSAARW